MALAMPSPTAMNPPYSFYNDSASSPSSSKDSKDIPGISEYQPSSLSLPQSPYPQTTDPSPVDSNGTAVTDTTEIDDDAQDGEQKRRSLTSTDKSAVGSPTSPLGKINTSVLDAGDQDGPQSVIHAPADYKKFTADSSPASTMKESKSQSSSNNSEITIASPQQPLADKTLSDSKERTQSPTINTDVPLAQVIDRSTPRAQTMQEAEEEWKRRKPKMSLSDIPEGNDFPKQGQEDGDDQVAGPRASIQSILTSTMDDSEQIKALNLALTECWAMCTRFSGLSFSHRSRVFNYQGQTDVQEHAWKSCWRLCQNLYESRDEEHGDLTLPTLEMTRDFCQALFDARQKGDETSDSVLRVSFELNNHLYNTHDRNLPPAFQERTLEFYLTLCHRLMKQRTSLPQETDSLLRACWYLAEMLFSLRQNKRDGKAPDEDLLSSAVQACWDLCDLFREGWTQVRPGTERSTPRANQTTFASSASSYSYSSARSSPLMNRNVSGSTQVWRDPASFPPETPTTIFDDMTESPLDHAGDEHVPNILVLGPDQSSMGGLNSSRWTSSSSASSVSGYSESSQRSRPTASTATASAATEIYLAAIRILLLKAATNAGFQVRNTPSPKAAGSSAASVSSSGSTRPTHLIQQNLALQAFVKALPSDSFGPQSWQAGVLEKYRRLISHWSTLYRSGTASTSAVTSSNSVSGASVKSDEANAMLLVPPSSQRRVMPSEIGRAVRWMMRSERNAWLRDLFRIVFGTFPDDAQSMAQNWLVG